MDKTKQKVTWVNQNTGEIKERSFAGRDPVIWSEHAPTNPTGKPQFRGEFDEWEMTPLEMALDLVPDLVAVLTDAKDRGVNVNLFVETSRWS